MLYLKQSSSIPIKYESGMYGQSKPSKIKQDISKTKVDKDVLYTKTEINIEKKQLTSMHEWAKEKELATHKNTFRSYGNKEHLAYIIETNY